jgi:hypothetical protein
MLPKVKLEKRVPLLPCSLWLLTAAFFFRATRQVHADPITEAEPNDSSATAQMLNLIG